MNTKDCPSCGAVVPASAARCKECFHDFNEAELEERRGGSGVLLVLATLAAMAMVGAATMWFIVSAPVEEKILVDQETQSVVWTRKFRSGIETDRLRFNDVTKLEYVLQTNGAFAVVAITTEGDRKTIHEGPKPLRSEARRYAEMMDKPLDEVDNTTGFHKMDE